MTMAKIISAATGLPARYYRQDILAAALRKYCAAMQLEFELDDINSFFTNVKIDGRYFAFPIDSMFEKTSFGKLANQSIGYCLDLAEKTINNLLEKNQLAPTEVDQIVTVTLTPFGAPSIDANLMNRIPFSRHLKRMPLTGLGCMGGAASLARAADYLQGHPKDLVIVLAVEICSYLWQGSIQADLVELSKNLKTNPKLYGDLISQIVTAALFADGCGTVLLAGREHPLAQRPGLPSIIDSRGVLIHNTKELMGLDFTEDGFRNILRPDVAENASMALRYALGSLLADHNLSKDDISWWIVHPGGPKVIQAVQDEFQLKDEQLALGRKIFARVGNVSSATVIFMLEDVLKQEPPPPGSYGVLVAMGPGFSQEALLLQW